MFCAGFTLPSDTATRSMETLTASTQVSQVGARRAIVPTLRGYMVQSNKTRWRRIKTFVTDQ